MKKKYITPAVTVIKTDTESLLAGASKQKNAIHLVDKTTKGEQIRSSASSDVNQFLFGFSDGGGTPNAKDNGWDLWEE